MQVNDSTFLNKSVFKHDHGPVVQRLRVKQMQRAAKDTSFATMRSGFDSDLLGSGRGIRGHCVPAHKSEGATKIPAGPYL